MSIMNPESLSGRVEILGTPESASPPVSTNTGTAPSVSTSSSEPPMMPPTFAPSTAAFSAPSVANTTTTAGPTTASSLGSDLPKSSASDVPPPQTPQVSRTANATTPSHTWPDVAGEAQYSLMESAFQSRIAGRYGSWTLLISFVEC